MTMQGTRFTRVLPTLAGAAGLLATRLAMAHLGTDGGLHSHDTAMWADALAGARHPFTGLDHLAAMLSVGAWSALGLSADAGPRSPTHTRALLAAPAAFALTLLLGALLGMAGLQLPGVEPMIAASLLVLGLLVSTRLQLPTAAGAALVAVFALFHGLAHGAELGGAHPFATLAGMVLATASLHAAGLAAGLAMRDSQQPARRWLRRASGAVVALLGLSLLAPTAFAAL
jgi:urease accessory protein